MTLCQRMQELEVAKQEEECHLRQTIQDLEDAAVSSQAVCQGQLHVLEQQIVELREIIDASMHTKRASTLKLETAMNALNLSKGDAKRFIEVLSLMANMTSVAAHAFTSLRLRAKHMQVCSFAVATCSGALPVRLGVLVDLGLNSRASHADGTLLGQFKDHQKL